MSTENVHQHLADHLAVQQLLNRYTNALNKAAWDAMADLFTEDADWRVIRDGEVEHAEEGRDRIIAFLRDSQLHASVLVQMNHAPVIHIDGDRASASSTMEAIYWLRKGGRQQAYAMYDDDLVREADQEWRFARREFHRKATITFVD
jgi:uncharacterized protein (TIGR02246 family)